MTLHVDLFLVFPPLSTSHGSPELGIPQLTATLRDLGFSVEQRDWNIEFIGEPLMSVKGVAHILERAGCRKPLPPSALADPRTFLDLLFAKGVRRKAVHFNGEYSGEFIEH